VALTISVEEFHVLANATDELAYQLRRSRFVFAGMAPGAESIDRPAHALEMLGQHLRALGHRYNEGEGLVASVLGRIALGLTPLALAATWVGTFTGLLPSSPVLLRRGAEGSCAPPQGFAQLLERIPQSSAQVRIDRLGHDSDQSFVVYIAGTQDFGARVSQNPWDMTSNAQALSDVAVADSERAVRQAMALAGIDASTPVIVVGHSQGGLIAARLAATGDFNITDVVVAGSPSHRVSIPEHVRVTAFEHSDDFIPALSGPALAGVAAGTLAVRAPTPTSSRPVTLPSHELQGYVKTARAADASADSMLRARKNEVSSRPGQGCTSTDYQATRAR
jgi:pimeloyl-ACP methyl ester carboxylesterase